MDDLYEGIRRGPRRDHYVAEEATVPEKALHEPVINTVRHMRRQIWFMLAVNVLVLVGLGSLVYYQTVVMGSWRSKSREIQTEILERVRAHDSVFKK